MDGRKRPVVLNNREYRALELARIKYENETQKRAEAFGEVIEFLAKKYLEKTDVK